MSTNLEIGILGLPKTGKTTLFNALIKSIQVTNAYTTYSIEPNIGVVSVPDERLEILAKIFKAKKTTPASMKFVDIVGLAKGASTGSGLGNKFLSHIRTSDAIIQVIRCFKSKNSLMKENSLTQIDILNTELCLTDLDGVERRMERIKKMSKSGDFKAKAEMNILGKIKENLEDGKPIRRLNLSLVEIENIKELSLLTLKPILYVANINEEAILNPEENNDVKAVIKNAQEEGTLAIVVAAKLEAEISQLLDKEAIIFAEEMGIKQMGLTKLIKASYKILGLISFLTAGEREVKAWTIKEGYKASKAAGKIHSDIERGFIRAEVIAYDDLVTCGTMNIAKDKGKVRLEGKEYVVKDGDIINFRFNV